MEHNNNSKLIIPQPGFVVKGVHGNSQKLFVNVCFSPDIGPAEESSDGRVRVPMSIGDLVDDLDKKLNPCKTVDIIVNEASVVRASDDTEFKKSFVEFLLTGVETKHKVKLEDAHYDVSGLVTQSLLPQVVLNQGEALEDDKAENRDQI